MIERSSDQAEERQPHRGIVLREPYETVLRKAVVAWVQDNADSASFHALGRCARAAYAAKVKPEHFVRLLRTMWYEQRPSARARFAHDPRLSHLIGAALDAYFANGSAALEGVTDVGDA